jgi:predicted RNase H-like nuclease (RuvC/YqgF family)
VTVRTNAIDAPVFGVDIQSGDIRGDAPAYALVVLDDGEISRDVVSFRKLCRLIDDEEPALVATDNAYELAADKNELVGFLRSLPSATKLVQVTGDERPEPLSRVASRHGVPYDKKPMAEAEAAARLATANVGCEVSAFTNTTTVKVARGRSTGSGGWSQDRYTRRIHGNVKKVAREVESKLDSANLDYTQDVTEKYGGYSNAIFTVEATPDELPVSTHRAGDTRIEIEREQRDGISYQPLVKRRDRVIVGIDPGTTTAAAVVSLDGRVLARFSSRTADTAEVTEWLIEQGRPLIVAADVTPIPETVESFRRSFEATAWTPESDLPVDEKLHRTRDHEYDNDHERDAMAAALYAYDDREDQFDRITEKTPPQFDREEVIAHVVANESSVEAAIDELSDEDAGDEEEPTHEPRELTSEEQRIKELETQVERLQSHNEELQAELADRNDTIEEYEDELSEAKREERREARERRAVSRLKRETDRLERERDEARERADELEAKLDRLKELWKLDHSDAAVTGDRNLVSVKIVEQFTNRALDDAEEEVGLTRGDIIYFRDASGAGRSTAERVADIEPRAIIRGGGLSDAADEVLFEAGIPVGPADDVSIQEIDELAVVDDAEIEALIDDWEERAESREREQKASMVDELISEHRADTKGS